MMQLLTIRRFKKSILRLADKRSFEELFIMIYKLEKFQFLLFLRQVVFILVYVNIWLNLYRYDWMINYINSDSVKADKIEEGFL